MWGKGKGIDLLSLLCISSILWVFHLPWIFWDQYKWILWQESCNTFKFRAVSEAMVLCVILVNSGP